MASNSTYGFKIKLRRYSLTRVAGHPPTTAFFAGAPGRGLHSSTFQLNLSRF
jgi:hypothetical protein